MSLPEPLMTYKHSNPFEHTMTILYFKSKPLYTRKYIYRFRLHNDRHLIQPQYANVAMESIHASKPASQRQYVELMARRPGIFDQSLVI